MNENWIVSTAATAGLVVVSAVAIYAALLLFTRLFGLRSFSKISGFDFAVTVALGTVLASTLLTPNPPLLAGITGLAVLYAIQWVVAQARLRSTRVRAWVDNRPLLVMAGTQIIPENLARARITEDDLKSKLRSAGITHGEQVFAVVVETTGDVSVIRSSDRVDLDLFSDVCGADRLR